MWYVVVVNGHCIGLLGSLPTSRGPWGRCFALVDLFCCQVDIITVKCSSRNRCTNRRQILQKKKRHHSLNVTFFTFPKISILDFVVLLDGVNRAIDMTQAYSVFLSSAVSQKPWCRLTPNFTSGYLP